MQSMSSQASSWTLMEDFFVQECCVHGTDLENHGPTSILCDDPLPIDSTSQAPFCLQEVDLLGLLEFDLRASWSLISGRPGV